MPKTIRNALIFRTLKFHLFSLRLYTVHRRRRRRHHLSSILNLFLI